MDVKHDEESKPTPSPDQGDDAILLTGWMTRAEVAADLKISIDTLQRWENQRIGPPTVRLGRKVYYRADAFREWLIAREKRPVVSARRAGGAR